MARSETTTPTWDESWVPSYGPAVTEVRSAQPAVPLVMQPVPAELWDTFASNFDGICQEQTYAFTSRRWPSVNHETYIFRHGEQVVGGVLVMVPRMPLGMTPIAVVNWGPVFKDAQMPERAAAYRAMLDLLVGEYANKRRMLITLQPRAIGDGDDFQRQSLIAHGFVTGSELPYPNRYIVRIEDTDATQRKSLHQKWRYHLSKSEKEGLVFEHAGADTMDRFAALYEAMSDRKNFPDYSAYATLPHLLTMSQDNLRPELFFIRQGEDTVAGAAIFKAGDTAVYLYGATNDRALPLRAGYFMHWHIMRWLKQHSRAQWYDLGGSDGFQGLHQFKKGMVGDTGVIAQLPPRYNYAAGRLPYLRGMGIFAIRDSAMAAKRLILSPWDKRAKADLPRGFTGQ